MMFFSTLSLCVELRDNGDGCPQFYDKLDTLRSIPCNGNAPSY